MLRTVHTSDEASVLLYCHGEFFPFNMDKGIPEVLNVSYTLIHKTTPTKIDSINTDKTKFPTILSTDGNLPKEWFDKFNVVVDYNCDHTGWSTNEKNFDKYTKPLYINMVNALNPKAFCFITNFEIPDFKVNTEKDKELKEKINKAEEKRLLFIEELIAATKNWTVDKILIEQEKKNYIIFFYLDELESYELI